jgi:hypothetical protein
MQLCRVSNKYKVLIYLPWPTEFGNRRTSIDVKICFGRSLVRPLEIAVQ